MRRPSVRFNSLCDIRSQIDYTVNQDGPPPCHKFPEATRGFLYFHRPEQAHPITSSIRFRLVEEPDPAAFSTGSDLLLPWQMPWTIKLTAIIAGNYKAFYNILIQDELISQQDLEILESSPQIPRHEILNSITDPFIHDFSLNAHTMTVRDHDRIIKISLGDLISTSATRPQISGEFRYTAHLLSSSTISHRTCNIATRSLSGREAENPNRATGRQDIDPTNIGTSDMATAKRRRIFAQTKSS